MRTTVTLEPEVYRLARAIAAQRHETIGKTLGDALLEKFRPREPHSHRLRKDEQGFPVFDFGRVITPEEVAEAIDEA